MNNDKHENPPQAVNRIPLTELYQALPEYLAETKEPFDVEAGLAELDAWIDEQEARDDRSNVALGDKDLELAPDRLDSAPVEAHVLQAALDLSPELAAQWLALQQRHMALQEKRQELEAFALRHNLEQQALNAANEREIQLRREDNRLSMFVHKLDAAGRRRWVPAVTVGSTSAAWLIGIAISVFRESVLTSSILVFAFSSMILAYLVILRNVSHRATSSQDAYIREDAQRVLRLLLLREPKEPQDHVG